MGSTTLVSMVNSVFAHTDDAAASANSVDQVSRPEIQRTVETINDALRKIYIKLYGSLRARVLDAVTTSVGSSAYDLSTLTAPLNTMEVLRGSDPLPQTNLTELVNQYGDLSATGLPTCWYRIDSKIAFYPTPISTETLTIVGSANFVPLVGSSDTTNLPEEYDNLPRLYAIGRAKLYWKDPDAPIFLKDFQDGLMMMHAEALRNSPDVCFRTDFDCAESYTDPTGDDGGTYGGL